MKTFTRRFILTTLAIALFVCQGVAQLVSTRITVQGSRYSDQMWVFHEGTCTRGFDNGWDGYKMIGTNSLSPQIFGWEETGIFQIDVVPDFANTYIGFMAGEDSVYTMTFNNEYLETVYKELHLIDSVAKDTIDIFASGTQYTFVAHRTAKPVKRFKLATNLRPPVLIPDDTVATPVDSIVPPVDNPDVLPVDSIVKPTDPIIPPTDSVVTPTDPDVTPTDPVVTPTDPVVTPGDDNTDSKTHGYDKNSDKHSKDKPNKKDKEIKIHNNKNQLIVENKGKHRGQLKIYRAITGEMVKCSDFGSNVITKILTNLPAGTYVVNVQTKDGNFSVNILIN